MFLAVGVLKGKTNDFVAYAVICIYLLLPPDKFEVVCLAGCPWCNCADLAYLAELSFDDLGELMFPKSFL